MSRFYFCNQASSKFSNFDFKLPCTCVIKYFIVVNVKVDSNSRRTWRLTASWNPFHRIVKRYASPFDPPRHHRLCFMHAVLCAALRNIWEAVKYLCVALSLSPDKYTARRRPHATKTTSFVLTYRVMNRWTGPCVAYTLSQTTVRLN